MKKLTRVFTSCDASRELSCTWYEGEKPVCRVYATFKDSEVDSLCANVLCAPLCPAFRIAYFVQSFTTVLCMYMNHSADLVDLNKDFDYGLLL